MKAPAIIKNTSKVEKFIIGLAIVILLGFIAHAVCEMFFEGGNKANAQSSLVTPLGYNYTCPAGQYPIGDKVCKDYPTGCAYGDSLPVDSGKCLPEEHGTPAASDEPTNTPTTPTPANNATTKPGGSCTL